MNWSIVLQQIHLWEQSTINAVSQNLFYEWENKKFQHDQKTFKYLEEIMQCFEINKFYVRLSNCKIFLHMINEKKLLWLRLTIFITFLVFILAILIIFIFVTQNLTIKIKTTIDNNYVTQN